MNGEGVEDGDVFTSGEGVDGGDVVDGVNGSGKKDELVPAENVYDFQNSLINPKSDNVFPELNRDAVLSQLDVKDVMEGRSAIELITLLGDCGLNESKRAYQADFQAMLVLNRSKDGFERRMLTTSTQIMRGNVGLYPDVLNKEKKFNNFFSLFRKRKSF